MIRREFLEKASLLAAGAMVGFTPEIKGLEEARARRHAELWAFIMPGDPVYEGCLFSDERRDVFGIYTNSFGNLVMPLSQIKKQMKYRSDAQIAMPGWMRPQSISLPIGMATRAVRLSRAWSNIPLPMDTALQRQHGTFVLSEPENGKIPVWMTVEDLEGILDLA